MKNKLVMLFTVIISSFLVAIIFIFLLHKTIPLPSYYSLTDVEGKNYVTSLKKQGMDSKLCWSFAETAAGESFLLKNHRDYVENELNKTVYDDINRDKWDEKIDDELTLSVAHNAMTLFVSPRDKFNNAGRSRSLPSNKYPSTFWGKIEANESMLVTNLSTWTTEVLEDDLLNWEKNKYKLYAVSLIDKTNDNKYFEPYLDKTVVNAESATINMYKDYMVDNTYDAVNTKEKTDKKFLCDMKKAIVDHTGVVLMLRYSGFFSDMHYEKKGSTNFGNCSVFSMSDETKEDNYSGHVLYAIGWDDDIEIKKNYVTTKGAIICKDSRGCFSLVPYDFNWASKIDGKYAVYTSFIDIAWTKSFSKYDNIYYYDSGNSDKIFWANERVIPDNDYSDDRYAYANPMYKSLINTFTINTDNEILKAVSYFSTTPKSKMEMSIYKIDEENIDSLKNMTNDDLLYKKTYTCKLGLNNIELDKDVTLNAGDSIAIKLKTTDLQFMTFGLDLSYYVTDDFIYRSEYKGKSYLSDINSDSFYGIFNKSDDSLVNEKDYTTNDTMAIDNLRTRINNNFNIVEIKDYLGDKLKGNLRIKLITNNKKD